MPSRVEGRNVEPVRAADMTITDVDVGLAASLFGIGDVESIGGYENALYRSVAPPGRVLRITHTSRRSTELVAAEFSYMEHLAGRGVPVVGPVHSRNGLGAEELTTEAGEAVVVACMTEAPGRYRRATEWSEAEIIRYGSLLSHLHAAASTYVAPPGLDRPGWTSPIFDIGFDAAHGEELVMIWHETHAAAAAHPAGAEDLLIHQDAHLGNLFITEGGEITLFDFDDCAYGTRTHDVAIVLFYWLLGFTSGHDPEAKRFLRLFLDGYRRNGDLPDGWQEGVDVILKLRELDIYHLVSISEEEPNEWDINFMRDRGARIVNRVPFADRAIAELT